MQSKRIDERWMLRFDPGEEIMEGLLAFCREQGIVNASLTGLGAASRLRVGLFFPGRKEYHALPFEGDYEIASLVGNITRKEGDLFAHVHVTFADSDLRLYGGHLFECEISATCEIVLTPLASDVERTFKPAIGLHTIDLD